MFRGLEPAVLYLDALVVEFVPIDDKIMAKRASRQARKIRPTEKVGYART